MTVMKHVSYNIRLIIWVTETKSSINALSADQLISKCSLVNQHDLMKFSLLYKYL